MKGDNMDNSYKQETGVKIATFKFKAGDEFENAEQFLRGLLYFGLVKPIMKDKNPTEGGILMPQQPDYMIVKDFTIGWEDSDGVSEVRKDTEVAS
jgi:hypothetical protein